MANCDQPSLAAIQAPQKEPLQSIEFLEDGPPFMIAFNGRACAFNPLPFAVLHVVFARVSSIGIYRWPKGHELALKCAEIRKSIDPQRYRPSTRDPEKAWAGWLDLTRKELRLVCDWINEYDLLPDGKKMRREGQSPKLTPNCKIKGIGKWKSLWVDAPAPSRVPRSIIESISTGN